jgi:hypothetical protein
MFLLFWIILSFISGYFASTKHRSAIGWFLLSILVSPIITLILLAILPKLGLSEMDLRNLSSTLEFKLNELNRLRDQGLISPQEYELRRKTILEND